MRQTWAADDLVLGELRAQTRWLRLLGLQALRPLLEQVLSTEKQRLVYELSDGQRTTREVGRLATVSAGTVSRLWSEWLAVGICSEVHGASGRAQHLASLSSLGIIVPGLPVIGTDKPIAADGEGERR